MPEESIEVRIATWDEDRDSIYSVRCDVFCCEQAIAEEIVFDGLRPSQLTGTRGCHCRPQFPP